MAIVAIVGPALPAASSPVVDRAGAYISKNAARVGNRVKWFVFGTLLESMAPVVIIAISGKASGPIDGRSGAVAVVALVLVGVANSQHQNSQDHAGQEECGGGDKYNFGVPARGVDPVGEECCPRRKTTMVSVESTNDAVQTGSDPDQHSSHLACLLRGVGASLKECCCFGLGR